MVSPLLWQMVGGDLPVNQNLGSLAGTVDRQFPRADITFIHISVIRGSGVRKQAIGTRSGFFSVMRPIRTIS